MHLTYGVGVVVPEHGGGALGIFKTPRLHHLQSAINHGRLFASGLFSPEHGGGALGIFKPPGLRHLQSAVNLGRLFASRNCPIL